MSKTGQTEIIDLTENENEMKSKPIISSEYVSKTFTNFEMDGPEMDAHSVVTSLDVPEDVSAPCVDRECQAGQVVDGPEMDAHSVVTPLDVPEDLSAPCVDRECRAGQVVDSRKRKQLNSEGSSIHKHQLKPTTCSGKCKKECARIVDDQRQLINERFWKLDYTRRTFFFRKFVKKTARQERNGSKMYKYEYHLPNADDVPITVCKAHFLTTLGLKPNNDEALRNALRNPEDLEFEDKRGRKPCSTKIDREPIVKHINSFQPAAPHYRYLHAPKRRYLPSDLSISKMFDDFQSQHPSFKIGIETYRKEVCSENIGFTVLGNEECAYCQTNLLHKKNNHNFGTEDSNCETCRKFLCHEVNANLAREEYKSDAERDWISEEIVVSVDLMKVFLLPVLPYKKCFFCPRLIAFNETFSVISKKKRKSLKNSVAILWHEGISGRDSSDIFSTFWLFLEKNREFHIVTFYVDNCAAQQKSWLFMSNLIKMVNSSSFDTKILTVKYLETGHTSMSADADHQAINKILKCQKEIADFPQFKTLVERVIPVHCMHPDEFRDFDDGVSQKKKLLLAANGITLREMRVVQVRRGCNNLFVKTSYSDPEFRECDILKNNFSYSIPNRRLHPRGVNKKKIEKIRTDLMPLMDSKYHEFWNDIRTSNSAKDLCTIVQRNADS